jgi:tRNA pseudouridine38-40 synthase
MEYDGGGFSGWQEQPGRRTVQAELERAIWSLTGQKLRVTVAGRTDAGVHALGQVVNFRIDSALPAYVFREGLNAYLPPDVAVLEALDAPPEFDARRSAKGKWYRYLVLDQSRKAAVLRDRAWWMSAGLDLAAMRAAAGQLIGEHDFTSFRSATCEAKSPVRDMRRIEIFRDAPGTIAPGTIAIELWASAFLKQMARSITGTLVEVGRGKITPAQVREALEARDRRRSGPTAPAQGLYLVRVDY